MDKVEPLFAQTMCNMFQDHKMGQISQKRTSILQKLTPGHAGNIDRTVQSQGSLRFRVIFFQSSWPYCSTSGDSLTTLCDFTSSVSYRPDRCQTGESALAWTAYAIIPQYCENLTIFCRIFTNIQTKSTDFALKMADLY